jgi:UDP-N-acetylglucosamine 2-epimerase (non-hydrolysing)
MKAAPVFRALRERRPDWTVRLVHTGQHYSPEMSDLFFRQLGMPIPDVNLGVGSGTHAVQTARIMTAIEEEFLRDAPSLVVVFGDVNSTLAATVTASKLQIPVAHVEAGLRSFDRAMPEEINRIVTDVLSSFLFTSEPSGERNLRWEGIAPEKIHFVGNTMIDTLLEHLARARALGVSDSLGLGPCGYAVMTLHRPSNVDDEVTLRRIMRAVRTVADHLPVVFPVHPRTRERIDAWGLGEQEASDGKLRLCEPLGYLEFLSLMSNAALVLTDSGGIQEETTILGVPCVTLRANTERPITIEVGTNVLAGNDPEQLVAAARAALDRGRHGGRTVPEKWDGRAAGRIAEILDRALSPTR